MTLKDQLMRDMQDSMRSGDELRKSTLRMARTAIRNAEMARGEAILEASQQSKSSVAGVPDEVFREIRERRRRAEEYQASAGEDPDPEDPNMKLANQERTEIGAIVARLSELDDAGVQDVLRKEIKQRRESAETYSGAGRVDLADKELAEVAILETYLPRQMSEDEIEAEVRAIIAETGATGPRDISKVMPAAMQRLRGLADGRTVNKVVTRLLTG